MKSSRTLFDRAFALSHALGATVAATVPAACLKDSPSALAAGQPLFQADIGTILVLGLYHDPAIPELDWWEKERSTLGDRLLRHINSELTDWFMITAKTETRDIPYQITDGGIYLKDAAVLAGLGVIGRNNLLLVPGFGPRIRFRALWVDLELPQQPLLQHYHPCQDCKAPCHIQCPCDAFASGTYMRERCQRRTDADKNAAQTKKASDPSSSGATTHCRVCEIVCPAGMPTDNTKK